MDMSGLGDLDVGDLDDDFGSFFASKGGGAIIEDDDWGMGETGGGDCAAATPGNSDALMGGIGNEDFGDLDDAFGDPAWASGGDKEAVKKEGGGEMNEPASTQSAAARQMMEEQRDLEVLTKGLSQLPRVALRSDIKTLNHCRVSLPGMPYGPPPVWGTLYGPCAAPQATDGSSGGKGAEKSSGNEGEADSGNGDVVMLSGGGGNDGEANGREQGQNSPMAKNGKPRGAVKSSLAWRRPKASPVIHQSFAPSMALAAYQACNRPALMARYLNMSPSRAQNGVRKLTPIDFALLHQCALSTTEAPRFQKPLPNSRVMMHSAHTIHNAFVCRPLLMQVGFGAHETLEHMLSGEGDEDPRITAAIDPLSLEAMPSKVASAVSQFIGAIQGVMPGVKGEQKSSLRQLSLRCTPE
jgi:hypothetical protein